ncbi:hypothetical protein [Nioella nitratireducens]|uniref:hypothetical protein n=1 Tax=Nioella nitratireducens TaxID=1287720 RepID=UPI0008FD4A1C|nr:hypothetical protein [Nioella nitratireducens]
MLRPRFGICLALSVLCAVPAHAQDGPTPEELAVRQASPGVVRTAETGDYTAIELELQGCRLVQTLMTNQGYQQGGPVGVQVLRMDLRDLDPVTGILPAEDTLNGDRRVVLMPSQTAWEEIQAAGAVFSQRRMAATERGDQDNPDAVNGARTLRTQAQRRFSADAIMGNFGAVMARTNVLQIRGDRGELIYPLVAPMQVTFSAEGAEAALAAINTLRAGPCASEDGIAVAPEAEGAATDTDAAADE